MRNIALFLTYEGTAYHGWQMQKNLATVQQTLEKAIAMIVGHDVHVTGCGRTDAGVHARCYVANFRTTSTIPVDRLPYALNTHLPVDIVVTKAFTRCRRLPVSKSAPLAFWADMILSVSSIKVGIKRSAIHIIIDSS